MSKTIYGYVILNKDGEQFGGVYNSSVGAKKSFNDYVRGRLRWNHHSNPYTEFITLYNDQDEWQIKALVLAE